MCSARPRPIVGDCLTRPNDKKQLHKHSTEKRQTTEHTQLRSTLCKTHHRAPTVPMAPTACASHALALGLVPPIRSFASVCAKSHKFRKKQNQNVVQKSNNNREWYQNLKKHEYKVFDILDFFDFSCTNKYTIHSNFQFFVPQKISLSQPIPKFLREPILDFLVRDPTKEAHAC